MRRKDIGPVHYLRSGRFMLIGAAVIVGLLAFASPASAHVTVTPSTTEAGAHAVLQFSVGHGCGSSPTTKVTIQIPAQITSVTPTRTALWTIEKQTETVDPPMTDHHGNKIVQRVASVTFTAETPLPDGYREVLELAVLLPEAAGTKLVFPTIQTCVHGESAWIEDSQDGQNGLALPAPGFTVSEPVDGAHQHVAGGNWSTTSFAALACGVLGSVLGGVALVRQRRRT